MKRRLLSETGIARPRQVPQAPSSGPARRSRRTVAALFGATAWLVALGYGCDESGPRVYTAQRHAVEEGCLETYAPIGLVDAETLSALCPPVCLGLGEDVYVSTLCPPYPREASIEPDDAEGCAAALAAPSCDELLETPDGGAL